MSELFNDAMANFNEAEFKLVHSELLCYAFVHANRSTVASLVDCVASFYRPGEVVAARESLWRECEPLLTALAVKKTRRPSVPVDRYTTRPFAEDVCTWVASIANSEQCQKMMVRFYALDLRRTPPCPPEEINVFSLAARVAALEKDRENCACNAMRHSSPPNERARFSDADAVRQETVPKVAPNANASSSDESGKEREWTDVVKKSTLRKQRQQAARKLVTRAVKDIPVVVGTATNSANTVVKGAKPTKALFVSNVERCSSAEITQLMKEKGVPPWDVHCTSKKNLPTASFRVTIRGDDALKVLKPDFWPYGVRCREWLPNVRRHKENIDAAAALEVPSPSIQGEIVEENKDDDDGEDNNNNHG